MYPVTPSVTGAIECIGDAAYCKEGGEHQDQVFHQHVCASKFTQMLSAQLIRGEGKPRGESSLDHARHPAPEKPWYALYR
jgi:hypothetical protein